MRHSERIAPGRRFDTVGSRGARIATWEVVEVFTSNVDGVLYARLARVKDMSEQRTIAVSALLDEQYYVPTSSNATFGP
jgi:hypothetical protein